MPIKLTQEIFIEKANKIHNNFYNYDMCFYKNCREKVCIICPIHGQFYQHAASHLQGKGCIKCNSKTIKRSLESFIDDANKVHKNKYIYDKSVYINSRTKIKIKCPIHGYFNQLVINHLQGCECPTCGKQEFIKSNTLNLEEFITKSNVVHDNFYEYTKTNYIGSSKKVTIICPIHGEFQQLAKNHMKGIGCPRCKESKGEEKIEKFLKNHNIPFKRNKTFINCKNKNLLPFDFYLPMHNTCIEFDGKQHFTGWWTHPKQTLKGIKQRDKIKTNYCLINNIKLLRIPYTEIKNIDGILSNYLIPT